ncbi:putative membrane protein [Methanonatronarchaeum thermophilum]|uniref:Putative membrane protein n=1 Tax=Methanonatronarchaeum thermophilum TaxID=1927129 RepID=A0A1Y3GBR4_9EURY|nr:hypothetical protein [Methanonatronarchaeum thermophilum]OUJ18902.1 putative membrane protein [Methanonatronarchaeum thermophilum]
MLRKMLSWDKPQWTLFIVALFLIIQFLIGRTPAEDHIIALLSALITAKAAIFAIIFSVTFLGVKSLTKYSIKLNWIFSENPELKKMTWIFCLAIFIDVIIILGTDLYSEFIISLLTLLAVLLTIAFIWSVYDYTKNSLWRITPIGILKSHENKSIDSYIDEIKANSNEDMGFHPLDGLYEMMMSSLSSKEISTTKNAIKTYKKIVNDILYSQKSDDELIEEIFKANHLKRITIYSDYSEELELARNSIDSIYEIGEIGIETNNKITKESFKILDEVFKELREANPNTITIKHCLNRKNDLLKKAARDNQQSCINKLLYSDIQIEKLYKLRRQTEKPWIYKEILIDYLSVLETVQENFLKNNKDEILKTGKQKFKKPIPNSKLPKTIETAIEIHEAIFGLTIYSMRYIDSGSEPPVDWGNFTKFWKRISVQASKHPNYAEPIFESLIETTYILHIMNETGKIDEDTYNIWVYNISRIKKELKEAQVTSEPDLISKTIKQIKKRDNKKYNKYIKYQPKLEKTTHGIIFGREWGRPINLESWIVKIEKKINKRYEEIK